MAQSLAALATDARACRLCAASLPAGPRPGFQVDRLARILIASQAPGRRVHASGVPFDDVSGDRLRGWMGVDRETFYDARRIAILPMGFCYPGTGPHGDLPPRAECAPAWRAPPLEHLERLELVIAVGRYAQIYHLGEASLGSLTDNVRRWRRFRPRVVPLPHPSPRNHAWLARHPWFEREVLPYLRRRVSTVLSR